MDRLRPRRAGFTLVELLVVILIIGALLAILVPTVLAAFRRAKEAQVAAELNNLATALADFKSKYGDYPPSRVLLCEGGYGPFLSSPISQTAIPGASGNGQNVSDISFNALAQRSLVYLNRFFPRADFIKNRPSGTPVGQFHDFNGNAYLSPNPEPPYILSGAECLVFFLGGMSSYSAAPGNAGVQIPTGLTGFSRSPIYPFVDSTNAPNRTTSIYEFLGGRLRDIDHDGVPTYLDAISNGTSDSIPYAYFSAYGSNSYDPNDINDNGHTLTQAAQQYTYVADNIEMDESFTPFPIMRAFSVSFPVAAGGNAISTAPNPYTTSVPVNASGTNYVNPNTFQLFSAGQDRLWGLGGLYQATGTGGSRLALTDGGNTNLVSPDDYSSAGTSDNNSPIRARERDNITNFSGGRLD